MVDADRLARLLRGIEADVSSLRGYAGTAREELLADERSLGHAKYLFVTALGGCVHAANHVCASEAFGPPKDNADAMRILGRRDVLPRDLAESMAGAVGFRNVLVHEYTDVDDGRVIDNLGRLDDIDAFVRALATLITA